MRLPWLAAAAVAALTADPAPARACSCGVAPPVVSPADQATDVPINAIVIAQFDYGSMPTVELRDMATNQLVTTTMDVRSPMGGSGATVFATPATRLAPNTTYQVTAKDAQNLGSIVTKFTTGSAVDSTPPAFAGLEGVSFETMPYPIENAEGGACVSSCVSAPDGHISRIRVAHALPPADAVHVALRFSTADDMLVAEIPESKFRPSVFGFEACDITSPVLTPTGAYCARVVAYDVAGNVAGADAVLCGNVRQCAARSSDPMGCEPADECVDPVPPPDPAQSASGCQTSRGSSSLLLIALASASLCRRRRRRDS